MKYIDVEYKRIHNLRNAQLDAEPKTRTTMTILVGIIFLLVIGLLIWANTIGVRKAYGMEAYTVMRVMEVKDGQVVIFSEDGVKFIVPMPNLDVKPLQEVLVSFHIHHDLETGNWISEPELGMSIEHILD